MLTTSKKEYALRADTEQPVECVSSAGQRNLTDLRRENF